MQARPKIGNEYDESSDKEDNIVGEDLVVEEDLVDGENLVVGREQLEEHEEQKLEESETVEGVAVSNDIEEAAVPENSAPAELVDIPAATAEHVV